MCKKQEFQYHIYTQTHTNKKKHKKIPVSITKYAIKCSDFLELSTYKLYEKIYIFFYPTYRKHYILNRN